ncbi:DUF7740 domain-containing protein [Pseudomonas syringae]
MTLSDAVLVLLLTERIHGNDDAIRRAAKNVIKNSPAASGPLFFR